jgi:hypothetical protein
MNWKEEFKKNYLWKNGAYRHEPKFVLAFIQTLLEKQEKEMRERIKGMKVSLKDKYYGKSEIEWGFENTYNQAIDDILSALKGKE